eukprot:sb/3461872/
MGIAVKSIAYGELQNVNAKNNVIKIYFDVTAMIQAKKEGKYDGVFFGGTHTITVSAAHYDTRSDVLKALLEAVNSYFTKRKFSGRLKLETNNKVTRIIAPDYATIVPSSLLTFLGAEEEEGVWMVQNTDVDVVLADRVDITQSMRNSYAYQSYFNNISTDPNRDDFLKATQMFIMDSGKTRDDSMIFSGSNIKNKGAEERAKKISKSKQITTVGKLHCPLLNSSKALPTGLPLRITLSKNNDGFLLMSEQEGYRIHLNSVHLRAKFIKPASPFLSLIESRLLKEPAPYHVCKPELIIRPIPEASQVLRLNNIFPGKLPHHAFFCVQSVASFEGAHNSNPFAFIPFTKFQFYCDGKPYFVDALEPGDDNDYAPYLHQLYKSLGMDLHGRCLVNSENFEQNFIVGLSLSPDREGTVPHSYISPQYDASTRLEIDLGSNATEDLVLIVYALYDRITFFKSSIKRFSSCKRTIEVGISVQFRYRHAMPTCNECEQEFETTVELFQHRAQHHTPVVAIQPVQNEFPPKRKREENWGDERIDKRPSSWRDPSKRGRKRRTSEPPGPANRRRVGGDDVPLPDDSDDSPPPRGRRRSRSLTPPSRQRSVEVDESNSEEISSPDVPYPRHRKRNLAGSPEPSHRRRVTPPHYTNSRLRYYKARIRQLTTKLTRSEKNARVFERRYTNKLKECKENLSRYQETVELLQKQREEFETKFNDPTFNKFSSAIINSASIKDFLKIKELIRQNKFDLVLRSKRLLVSLQKLFIDGVFNGTFYPLEAAAVTANGAALLDVFTHYIHQPYLPTEQRRFSVSKLGVVNPRDFGADSITELDLIRLIKAGEQEVVYTYGNIAYDYLSAILPTQRIVDLTGRVEAKQLTGWSACPYPHRARYCSQEKLKLMIEYLKSH